MSTLYELSDKYSEVYDRDDLDDETWLDTLESIDVAIDDKAENYGKIIRMFEGENETIDNEVRRLYSRKKSNNNKIKRMKLALQESMEKTGKMKIDTGLFKFGIQKNPPHVKGNVTLSDVPEVFISEKTEKVIDKKRLLNEWKLSKGQKFDDLVEQNQSLRIR